MKKNKTTIYILSFIIPVAIMLLAYLANGIFGAYTILINDLNSQYVTFLSYLRTSVFKNGILYSFAKSIGGNFFGIFSYYLASPLNLLVFLFAPQNIEIAVSIIILLRFGLYGLCFAWYLSQKSQNNVAIVVFSVLYALTSFNVVLSYHILWADAFILLPIIIAGQEKIFKGKSCKMFIISFAALLIINYYMAYMVAIFCVLYYIAFVVAKADKQTAIKAFFAMARSAVISLLIASWSLIPSFFSLLQGKLELNGPMQESGSFIFNPTAILPKLFVGGYAGVGNISAPFIYCGGGVFVLLLGYFFLKNKTKREKFSLLFLLAFLLTSLIYTPLYKMWHMFALTNAFPYRFIYILSFVMLTAAFEVFCNAKEIDGKKYLPFGAVFVAAVAAFGVWYPIHIRNVTILFTSFVMISVALLIFLFKNKKYAVYIAAVIMLLDISLNAYLLVGKTYNDLDPLPKKAYKQEYLDTQKLLEQIEDDDFYRISYLADPTGARPSIVNHSFKHSYNGFYYCFTSLPEKESENMLYNILYPSELAVRDAVVGVKYHLSYDEIKKNEAGFSIIYTAQNTEKVMRNTKQEDKLIKYITAVTGVNILEENGAVSRDKLIQAAEFTKQNSAVNIQQSKNKITGDIFVKNQGDMVHTSIIFDEGWRIKVNGKTVEKKRVLDNFLAFDAPLGESSFEMIYYPKGWITGVMISAISVFCLAIYSFSKRKTK